MEDKKLIPAPIDNKNILEDFSDDFHEGRYVETVENGIHKQAFWKCGVLCVLTYEFGNNWFDIQFFNSTDEKYRIAAKEIGLVIFSMKEHLVIKEGPGGIYLIYFKSED